MFKRTSSLVLNFGLVCLLFGMLSGCTSDLTKNLDPKRRLTEYVNKNFSVKVPADRAHLLPYLTGDVKIRLERWSDDQFREAFIDTKRQFQKLTFREVKTISPSEVQVTYELTYSEKGKGHDGTNRDAKITQKKLCQMVLENGHWMISNVRNIKELVEYSNELSLP